MRILYWPFLVGLALLLAPATAAEEPSNEAAPLSLVAERDFHRLDAQLTGLIAQLLERNPEVLAARASLRAEQERMPQARSLPDPQFSYRLFLDSPETRVGPQEHAFEVSQGLPWFGKRDLQARRVEQRANGLSWSIHQLERNLVAELKQAYLNAAYFQEALAINTDEAALLARFEQIALTRYSTGEGIQQSAIKVQTDISRLAERRSFLKERLDAVTRKIAVLLGRPADELELAPIRLGLPELDYDRGALERRALQRSPQVLAALQQIESDRTWIRRRQRDGYPDFSLGLGYTDVGRREDAAGVINPPPDNGQDVWALTVKVNVPLYRSRVRAGVAEAEQRLRASEEALQHRRDRLAFDLREALLRLESLDERVRLYREVIVPQAEESLASAESAYTTNRLSFLDLLDAERVLFQARLTSRRLLADYWIAMTDVERAIALPFPSPEGGAS